MNPYFILAFLSALVAVAFAWQNPGNMTLHFFRWNFEGSLAMVCMMIFALGFIGNFFMTLPSVIRRRWRIRIQDKRIKELEDELADKEKRPILDRESHVDVQK